MTGQPAEEQLRTHVRTALARAHISQAEAARQLGLSTKHLSQMLTGHATLTLTWADPHVWGEQPDDAGYVHGLAIRRDAAGQGLGAVMLAWAGRAVAAAGRPHLRLDCMAANAGLRAYYEHVGFTYVRDLPDGSWSASLYEKRTVSV